MENNGLCAPRLLRHLVTALLLWRMSLAHAEAQGHDSLASRESDEEEAICTPDEAQAAEARAGFLLWLRDHPYDLNAVTREELLQIPGVSGAEASAFIRFRKLFRRLSSLEQLRAMDAAEGGALIEKIRPYVRPASGEAEATGPEGDVRFSVLRKSSAAAGLGSPWRTVMRVRGSWSVMHAGVQVEKDAGERYSDAGVSGGLLLRSPLSWIDAVTLGDFAVEAGQGLVLWRSRDLRMSGVSPATLRRKGGGVRSQLAPDDVHQFRGAAVQWTASWLSTTIRGLHFLSSRSLPGSVDTLGILVSLSEDGSFTTPKKAEGRNVTGERLFGSRLECLLTSEIILGISCYRSLFEHPMQVLGAKDRVTVGGVDWSAHLGQVTLFGEVGHCGRGAAWIAGITCSPRPLLSWGVSVRNYGKEYNSFHGHGMGQGSGSANERGFSGCIEVTPLEHTAVRLAADLFGFPAPAHSSPCPVKGNEVSLRIEGKATPAVTLAVRLQRRVMERVKTVHGIDGLRRRSLVRDCTDHVTLRGTLRCSRQVSANVQLDATRAVRGSSGESLRGSLLTQAVLWEVPGCQLESRLTFYGGDASESRFTAVDVPLPGSTLLSMLYGTGWRWVAKARLNLPPWLAVSAFSAVGFREERILPGEEVLPVSFQREFALQIELKWP